MNEKEQKCLEALLEIQSVVNNVYDEIDNFFNELIKKLEAKGKKCYVTVLEEDESHGPGYDDCPLYDWNIERILDVDGHEFYIYDLDYEDDQYFDLISKTELVQKIKEKDPTYETNIWRFPWPEHKPAEYIEDKTHKLSVQETIEYILNEVGR